MEKLKVFFITEGGSGVGFGHVTRMLSIYQVFEENRIRPKLIINGDNTVIDLLEGVDFSIYNWMNDKERLLSEIYGADIAIIDSYLAGFENYIEINKAVKKTVYYDDYNRLDYPSGVIINGNVHAADLNYQQRESRICLLGIKYLPLRKEFRDVPEKMIRCDINSIMVTFGGDDSKDMTPEVLEYLVKNFPDKNKNLIIGRGFKNTETIKKLADEKTNLIYNASGELMSKIMFDSDLAISAGGQTLFELARAGVPTIAILIAENQRGNVEGFKRHGLFDNYLEYSDPSVIEKLGVQLESLRNYKKRKILSEKSRELVDGEGCRNIYKKLLSVISD